MLELILSSLYFILPAYVANMGPVAAASLPLGAEPISSNLFGPNKTWRGFLAGYLGAFLVLFIQTKISLPHPTFLNYATINPFLYAIPFGLGALAGDLIKSFFKRKIGIKSGGPWPPFDQLDFIIGALIALSPLVVLPVENILVILLLTPLLHLLTNITAYLIGLKKVWW